eukprot:Unigene12415_Nuclearia_a/m.37724 Unigene12415_Nuclearia_a/g.37724  ORF Unigene12415_Nuclearia_a/g.37724 Unigene12415_Nuclearia_a/m.37724 type:complete len:341 (-) Unigene12415_Nuclearia_a:941-1963(-)
MRPALSPSVWRYDTRSVRSHSDGKPRRSTPSADDVTGDGDRRATANMTDWYSARCSGVIGHTAGGAASTSSASLTILSHCCSALWHTRIWSRRCNASSRQPLVASACICSCSSGSAAAYCCRCMCNAITSKRSVRTVLLRSHSRKATSALLDTCLNTTSNMASFCSANDIVESASLERSGMLADASSASAGGMASPSPMSTSARRCASIAGSAAAGSNGNTTGSSPSLSPSLSSWRRAKYSRSPRNAAIVSSMTVPCDATQSSQRCTSRVHTVNTHVSMKFGLSVSLRAASCRDMFCTNSAPRRATSTGWCCAKRSSACRTKRYVWKSNWPMLFWRISSA